jgi:DNA-binding LytR/AlgR family response regulator
MKKFEESLPTEDFIRIHKSYLININKVDALVTNGVIIGDTEVPISRTYKPIVKDFIDNRLNA